MTTLLTNAAGTQRALFTTTRLLSIIAAGLVSASISPQSQVVGVSGVSINIQITLLNILYVNGKIQVYFPVWNPTEESLATHQIIADQPNCINVQGMKSVMSCTYDTVTQNLTVTSILDADAPSGSVLIFNVDNFQNPYSGIPRTGYSIITTDSVGGAIDSSVISSLNITLIVTSFASFDNIYLTRVDTQQIVSELSTGQINFELSLPIDASCRI